jgi:nicotinate-nucleotide adenylyltransferase
MIGILGGSFDPVHAAHLAMADAFASALSLDEVRFTPASQPWQKHRLSAAGADRAAMLSVALAHHRPPRGRYVVDPRELRRGGETYTIDTLVELRAELGDDVPIVFLFGADQLVHLDTWRDWRRLWDHAHLAAVTRPGFDVAQLPEAVAEAWSTRAGDADALRSAPAGRSFLLEGLLMDISATGIRAALASNEVANDAARASLGRLVPSDVLDYIQANHLYRS